MLLLLPWSDGAQQIEPDTLLNGSVTRARVYGMMAEKRTKTTTVRPTSSPTMPNADVMHTHHIYIRAYMLGLASTPHPNTHNVKRHAGPPSPTKIDIDDMHASGTHHFQCDMMAAQFENVLFPV